jgi:hypothetical protein
MGGQPVVIGDRTRRDLDEGRLGARQLGAGQQVVGFAQKMLTNSRSPDL